MWLGLKIIPQMVVYGNWVYHTIVKLQYVAWSKWDDDWTPKAWVPTAAFPPLRRPKHLAFHRTSGPVDGPLEKQHAPCWLYPEFSPVLMCSIKFGIGWQMQLHPGTLLFLTVAHFRHLLEDLGMFSIQNASWVR